MQPQVLELTNMLREGREIVFFGGAGVSTASGIPDFRSCDGLYKQKLKSKFTPEELISHTVFREYPEIFYEFYKTHLISDSAKPNRCHMALAKLEQIGKLSAVITQNIDGLHQMSGSKCVYELHGSIHRNYCVKCHEFYDLNYIKNSDGIPRCHKCGSIVKPDVVLYEEALDDQIISQSVKAIAKADTLIIGGTSLVVYPAAGLIRYFSGKNLILINKTTTSADKDAKLIIHDNIDTVMYEAVMNL